MTHTSINLSLILLCFLSITRTASAQIPVKDNKAFYELVDSSITGGKEELQVKAKMWMADAFKDSKEVIRLDDKSAGEVLGKGNVKIGYFGMRCRFTIKISTRDNKYRCQVYDLSILPQSGTSETYIEDYITHPNRMGSKKTLSSTDDAIKSVLEEVRMAMKKENDNF